MSLGRHIGDTRRRLRRIVVATAAAAVLVALVGPAASGAAPSYEAFGSCAVTKPFPRARHCRFDSREHAQGTIVFRSHVGKRKLKLCQRILGLSFKGRQCLKTKTAVAYEATPFALHGAYAKFRLVVTIYAKAPGAGSYKRSARVGLRFSP